MRWNSYCSLGFLILSLLVCGASAFGSSSQIKFCELKEMSMEQYKIANNRDSYYPYDDPVRSKEDEYWLYGAAVKFDVDLVKYGPYAFHWKNNVNGQSTNVQFRAVSWDFRWGLQLGDKVELFYDHVSSHIMEATPENPRTYGLKNTYGVELTFYRRDP